MFQIVLLYISVKNFQQKLSIRINFAVQRYKRLYTISNKIDVYEEPVPRKKEILHYAAKFKASEEDKIEYEICTDFCFCMCTLLNIVVQQIAIT